MEKILTVPSVVTAEQQTRLLTGNEFVSLSGIGLSGEITGLGVVRMDSCSLIEMEGEPLIRPGIVCNGVSQSLVNISHCYVSGWIPELVMESEKVKVWFRICAPPGYKGFVYTVSVVNKTADGLTLDAELILKWKNTNSSIFSRKTLPGISQISENSWTESAVLEFGGSSPLVALSLSGSGEFNINIDSEKLELRLVYRKKIKAGGAEEFSFFAGVNREADGASLVCMDLRRRGAEALFSETTSALDSMAVRIDERYVSERANRNLFFAYYYSSALTIDTEELVLLTSRSSDYYVSGAYWSRDSLLWSFPGILLIDPGRARDILLTCFSRYLNNAGIHSLYLSGTVLYPGFELDELAAYLTALEGYLEGTGDIDFINDPCIIRGLKIIRRKINERYSADTGLYSTELDPSDDPVKYPFLTFSNVLLLKGFRFLEKYGLENAAASVGLEAALRAHCVKVHGGKAVYVWSTDGQGNYELYDDPPGSLLLLPYYGFCSREDEVYRNTVEWIYSSENPYFYPGPLGNFTGCEHSPYPWLLSGCNYLLNYPEDREQFYRLAALPLDDGFGCECLHGETGRVLTGKAFATCAGFYGYTLASLSGTDYGGAVK